MDSLIANLVYIESAKTMSLAHYKRRGCAWNETVQKRTKNAYNKPSHAPRDATTLECDDSGLLRYKPAIM
ncbi:hypothetical protein D1093_00975 [Bartonella kosoyi]|uniref:Uncharacterized protein n=1 Tax=Bartonella kosoyi TaxID=2133959 RepID=A0A5B9CUB8_9HYPH|nr:hypothetical protein [Bartonella kosoyi]QEE08253.1 hypothetical protein D1093_00975 [Bartonella kosoyi]